MSEKAYFYIARKDWPYPFIDIFTEKPTMIMRSDARISWDAKDSDQHLTYGSFFIPQMLPLLSIPLGKLVLVSVLDEEKKCVIEIEDGDVKHETQFIP